VSSAPGARSPALALRLHAFPERPRAPAASSAAWTAQPPALRVASPVQKNRVVGLVRGAAVGPARHRDRARAVPAADRPAYGQRAALWLAAISALFPHPTVPLEPEKYVILTIVTPPC
jgi:hypothetical protein